MASNLGASVVRPATAGAAATRSPGSFLWNARRWESARVTPVGWIAVEVHIALVTAVAFFAGVRPAVDDVAVGFFDLPEALALVRHRDAHFLPPMAGGPRNALVVTLTVLKTSASHGIATIVEAVPRVSVLAGASSVADHPHGRVS